jgi:hypothetical protein
MASNGETDCSNFPRLSNKLQLHTAWQVFDLLQTVELSPQKNSNSKCVLWDGPQPYRQEDRFLAQELTGPYIFVFFG